MAPFLKRTWRRALGRNVPARDAVELSEPIPKFADQDTSYPAPPPAAATDNRSLPPFDSEDPDTKHGEDVSPLFTPPAAEYGEQYGLPRPPPREQVGWVAMKMRDLWVREILSLLCSLVSTLTIVVILALHDNKQLKDWSGGVSLNAYLAIFTTIAKAFWVFPVMNCIGQLKWIWFYHRSSPLADFAAYDDATRGPWDSLMLLKRIKFWHTASFGALVLVLSTAISPLTQQTLAYPSRLVASPDNLPAYVPTSNYWDGTSGQESTNYRTGILSLPIKQAVYNALYTPGSGIIPAIAPTCSSGNCTFPQYDSLAVCSTVTNVTDLLVIETNEVASSVISNVTLPNGASLSYGVTKTNISSSSAHTFLRDNSTTGLPISFAYIIYEATGRNSIEIEGLSPRFNALEMVHYWCVNTFNTSVEHGNASTKIVASSNLITYNNGDIYDNITISPPRGHDNYNVTGNSNQILRSYMSDIFQGNYNGGYPGYFGGPSSDLASVLQPIVTANTSSLVMEGVGNYTQNMATSMTNSVRSHIGNGLPPYRVMSIAGTAYVTETYIEVRWHWLLLLMGLVAASIIFLIGTIIKTCRSGVAVMKSDALAAVTILGPEARNNWMGPTDMQRGTVRRAEELRVKLRHGAEGWSLDVA